MKRLAAAATVAMILAAATTAPAFAGIGVATTCGTSEAFGSTEITLSAITTAAKDTATRKAVAGTRAHFEWHIPGVPDSAIQYGDETSNTKSVVIVDTKALPAGTYKAVSRLMMMTGDQVVGWGKCVASFTVSK